MDIISYVHESVELLVQILGLIEVWTRRSMELSPASLEITSHVCGLIGCELWEWIKG